MPFDLLNKTEEGQETAPTLALYRERRETVAKRLAVTPPEIFDLVVFTNQCGTTACALGWLAHWKHDGWTWDEDSIEPTRGTDDSFEDAAAYFGISYDTVSALFGGGGEDSVDSGGLAEALYAAAVARGDYQCPRGGVHVDLVDETPAWR